MSKALTYQDISAALKVQDGHLVWRVSRGSARAGMRAGKIDQDGYVGLVFSGHSLKAHRVVWLLTYGEWPVGQVDHIDGQRANNLPCNLRLCDHSKNQMNSKARGKIKFKGVVQLRHGRYQAQCGKKYLGSFDTPEMAAKAYDAAAFAQYGEFSRLNFGGAA